MFKGKIKTILKDYKVYGIDKDGCHVSGIIKNSKPSWLSTRAHMDLKIVALQRVFKVNEYGVEGDPVEI